MFERLTDRARRVVVLSQEEARLLAHNYIGTEHLLLGLIHEGEGIAALALQANGVDLEKVRARVEEVIGTGEVAPAGHIPFTPRARKVLELSLREALQLGHAYLGTEHLLLGLIREGEGMGAQLLDFLGVDLGELRRKTLEITGVGVPAAPTAVPAAIRRRVTAELMTDLEREIVQDLGDVWAKIREAVGKGKNRKDDLRELAVHLHALQHAVMAQATARAFPDDYRMLGD